MAARPTLGILAGAGELPLRVIDACRAGGQPVFVLAFAGEADPARFDGVPHASVRLGAAADALRLLRENGVEELVFAGRVRRPSLAALRPDWRAAQTFPPPGLRAPPRHRLLREVLPRPGAGRLPEGGGERLSQAALGSEAAPG